MFKKNSKAEKGERFIDIEAGLQGDVKFNTPVNLKISGKLEGTLEIKGTLIISEKADVKTRIIKGEDIIVAGKVEGDIVSSKRLELLSSAKVTGNIKTRLLVVNEGAMLKGSCQMPFDGEEPRPEKKSKKRE